MAQDQTSIVHLEKKNLKPVLGAKDLFAIGYGDLGASIYYALGLVALYALGATPLALLIAGLVFVCTALTYAEMATTFPEPGGSATFSRYAFNDLISFLAGWALLLDYILTLAISAFAIPPYFKSIGLLFGMQLSTSVEFHIVGAIAIIIFLFFLNFIGIKISGKLSWQLSLVTIVSQALILVLAGIFLLNLPYIISQLKVNVAGANWSPNWFEFLKGIGMAMVAYTGVEAVSQLAAETKKPSIAIPKAIKWIIFVLLVLYMGISFIGLSVITPQELGTKYLDNPIIGIIEHLPFGGKWLSAWFGLIASVILLISANAGLIGCSRLTFSMGEYYQMPRIFFTVHPKYRTPHIALAIFAILASVVVILSKGRLLFLADLYNFGAQIAFFSAHISLIVLRFKRPKLHRPFKAPLNIPFLKNSSIPLTAIIGAIGSFSVWILVLITKPEGRNIGFLWLAIGLGTYLLYRKKKQIDPLGSIKIEKVKIPDYAPMHLRHILVTTRSTGSIGALQTACQLAKSYGAKITALYVLEIPPSLPMHARLLKREELGGIALKRAEAIAHEFHLSIDLKLVRARSFDEALLDMIGHGEYDMAVVALRKLEAREDTKFLVQLERLMKEAPCKVLVCKA